MTSQNFSPRQKALLNNLMNKGYSYNEAIKELSAITKENITVSVAEKCIRKYVNGNCNRATYNYKD